MNHHHTFTHFPCLLHVFCLLVLSVVGCWCGKLGLFGFNTGQPLFPGAWMCVCAGPQTIFPWQLRQQQRRGPHHVGRTHICTRISYKEAQRIYVCMEYVFMCARILRKSSACVGLIPGVVPQLWLARELAVFVSTVTELSLPPTTQVELSITLASSQ